jgi:transposase
MRNPKKSVIKLIVEKIVHCSKVSGYRPRRWVVELTHSWLNRFWKLLVRYEKLVDSYIALIHLAFSIICWRKIRSYNVIYG